MTTQNQYLLIGKGTIYLSANGGPLLPCGNVSVAQLSWEEDEKSMPDYQNPGGGALKTVKRVLSAVFNMTAHDLKPEMIATATRGAVTAYAGGTVTNEAHNDIQIGGLIPFDHIPDPSVAPVVKQGATTLAADDYEVTTSGIIPLADGTNELADGDDLTVSYTGLADNLVQMLVSANVPYRIFVEGLNEAESGRPHTLDVYKAVPGMAPLDLIADDFAGMPLSFAVNKDVTKSGNGISQYAAMKMAKAT
jgi:hypothetical protein